jgi:hypothetical protein
MAQDRIRELAMRRWAWVAGSREQTTVLVLFDISGKAVLSFGLLTLRRGGC